MWKTQGFLENPEFISAESMSWCRETLGFLENSRISGKSRIYWRHWDFQKTQGFLENPKYIPADHPGPRFPKILGCPLGVSSPHPSPLFPGAPKESPSSGMRELAGCGNWRDLGIGGIWEFQPGKGSRIPSFLALPAPGRPPRAVRSPPMPGPFPMPAPPEAPDAPKASVSAGTEPPPPPEPPGE